MFSICRKVVDTFSTKWPWYFTSCARLIRLTSTQSLKILTKKCNMEIRNALWHYLRKPSYFFYIKYRELSPITVWTFNIFFVMYQKVCNFNPDVPVWRKLHEKLPVHCDSVTVMKTIFQEELAKSKPYIVHVYSEPVLIFTEVYIVLYVTLRKLYTCMDLIMYCVQCVHICGYSTSLFTLYLSVLISNTVHW